MMLTFDFFFGSLTNPWGELAVEGEVAQGKVVPETKVAYRRPSGLGTVVWDEMVYERSPTWGNDLVHSNRLPYVKGKIVKCVKTIF